MTLDKYEYYIRSTGLNCCINTVLRLAAEDLVIAEYVQLIRYAKALGREISSDIMDAFDLIDGLHSKTVQLDIGTASRKDFYFLLHKQQS